MLKCQKIVNKVNNKLEKSNKTTHYVYESMD